MFDDLTLKCFLDNQLKLFPEEVALSLDEAREFLEESGSYVANDRDEVWEYFDEVGIDTEGMELDELLEASEVFDIGDGRYLIVEG